MFEIAKNRKVYIWGAWEVGYFLQQKLEQEGLEVFAYLDGKAAGGSFHEKPVQGTDDLKTLAADPSVFVFAACKEHPAIKHALEDAGFQDGENMLYLGTAFQVRTSSAHYADLYGNEMRTGSTLPEFSIGMCAKIRIGRNVQIGENVKLIAWGGAELIIGDNVKIGDNTLIEVRDVGSIEIGEKCTIESDVIIRAVHAGKIRIGVQNLIAKGCDFYSTGSEMVSGERVSFNQNINARFFNGSRLLCGSDCTISYYTKLRGDNGHTIIDLDKECVHPNRKDVVIEDHVWVGMGASLLGGTVLEKDCIVGADSLVTKGFPAGTLIAGNPAKVIRENVTWDMRPDISYEEWKGHE
ncbi:MAG: hypothetical protein IKS87_00760 [Lachnospiraceae bacterium]|nr:hypothetical protein [Lachnospiraceae bacterium]